MTTFTHYYHIYADGPHWPEAVEDHLKVLDTVDVPYQLVVGVTGNERNCDQVIESIEHLSGVIFKFNSGWEHNTLELIIGHLETGFISGPVLYTHSKGSANKSEINTVWRQCMESHVVGKWKQALEELEQGASTVGVHWLEKEHWPGMNIKSPFYGGNYWWASVDHLRLLPPLNYESRWGAEEWIGLVDPENPVDLISPNIWPGNGCPTHS